MEKNLFKTYCLNLAKIRISKNILAYELSLRLGKDASYVHKVENGKINISLKMMIKISEILETDITKFFEV